MAKQHVMAECTSCGATGIYQGFCEAKDEGVICLQCNGMGKVRVSFTPFNGRKRKRGIVSVRKSRGTFLATGVGGVGTGELYNDWFKRTEK